MSYCCGSQRITTFFVNKAWHILVIRNENLLKLSSLFRSCCNQHAKFQISSFFKSCQKCSDSYSVTWVVKLRCGLVDKRDAFNSKYCFSIMGLPYALNYHELHKQNGNITTKHSPMGGLKITNGRSSPRYLTTCSASDLLNVYVLGRLHRILKYYM